MAVWITEVGDDLLKVSVYEMSTIMSISVVGDRIFPALVLLRTVRRHDGDMDGTSCSRPRLYIDKNRGIRGPFPAKEPGPGYVGIFIGTRLGEM